ncbi:ferric reductase family protein [Aspergillus affinis]|uniref:ferric reductase family protein n=1 Tax=Aspergillus affinis TaxID=1070780 RepID=UPI0022FDF1CB|nr:ferric reductase [Aspergillus affinis]KAI9037795.1 ferric reductase [Aspergillus affinis]
MNPALATPLYVLGGVFFVLFIGRAIIRLRHRRRRQEALEKKDQSRFVRSSRLSAFVKKHILYAPLFTTRHSREFRLLDTFHMGVVPLRLETLLLLGYIALNLIFFFALIDWWAEYSEMMYQLKYAGGHLAVMNSPALVLTAGRNNPLIWLLGLPFDTFNLMHRWIGRLMVAGGILHVICVVVGQAQKESMSKITYLIWHTPFFVAGLVALIAFVAIFLQSASPVRHAFYEAFLHLHIVLAIMAFVGLWYHLQGLAQQWVMLATLVLWGLDRAGRLGLILWRNFGRKMTRATVELLPGDVARVDVTMARSWQFKAGQYMYLYIPSLGLWTSHPFSVAWKLSQPPGMLQKRGSGDSLNALLGEPQQAVMSFLIKRRDGFTHKLVEKVNKSPDEKFTARALAEGPFGGLHSLNSYGTVVLVAGGIGITHPMSYMQEFVSGFAARMTAVRKVTLVWVVRSLDHLTWIQPWMTTLLNHPAIQVPNEQKQHSYFSLPEFSLSVQIYVTLKETSTEDFKTGESPWANTVPPTVPISLNFGKPSFDHILETEKATQVGAMAVSVCGPGAMGDDVRKTVREKQGSQTMDLYEETFSW